ncbi:uncharacterized protein LACBIDRAFT_334880 [Laccaria bicolor S238N-H82]|uniref:Predicted protein n=1 Tax=Laccaria bicolor (strain S238N-H82 / ATCC MYA-4686) TaxID=486041 RepID=B0E0M9_LACBS|nr:uncharacterized protein LACBIDRAFT_334880 [Laccaria bicolor S238N-H82]EDQ99615.1 predicted protein [Laccaria bicolor S238N-H82]|eukprot:XP_001889726.1 predicted protein [Laccaria bicolor S238N-H82]
MDYVGDGKDLASRQNALHDSDGLSHYQRSSQKARVARYKPKISNPLSWVRLSIRKALRLNDHGVTNQASVMCYIEEIGACVTRYDPDAKYDIPMPPDHNDITATFTPPNDAWAIGCLQRRFLTWT